MRTLSSIAMLLVILATAGCGVSVKVDARNEYRQSLAAYKACVASHPDDAVSACQSQKLAMEADERAYNAFAAGSQPGGVRTLTVNSQSR